MADAIMTSDMRAGALTRPFAGLEPFVEAGPLTLREMPLGGQIDLRGDPKNAGFLEAVASVLSCALPLAPNTAAQGRDVLVLWLGPDEWLVLSAPGMETGLVGCLREAFGDRHCAVVDVTGNRTIFRLLGAGLQSRSASLVIRVRSVRADASGAFGRDPCPDR
ncbi:sarcosine oxidase subunit gamma family protein [Breoghania sp.]|uniref:sarcosine oxidase subunit gamma n=1 Tax=Breoghania sp. TaxID=2065378 RepID=UPI002620CA39|nr:sarcosine oxidase subunit gamma family protein [Breoghania sp.]MDJ0932995.1 sarcosine oxidase subunit gamma family protein [Breoghania sp.]